MQANEPTYSKLLYGKEECQYIDLTVALDRIIVN